MTSSLNPLVTTDASVFLDEPSLTLGTQSERPGSDGKQDAYQHQAPCRGSGQTISKDGTRIANDDCHPPRREDNKTARRP